MKKHIPNFLTCLNLIVGALGCISIVKGDLWNAIYFVVIAAAFDFLDGFVARILNVKSEIGKQLDSLADMVSFGLLPALYMLGSLNKTSISPPVLSYLGILIVAFSAIRLAKFNVDDRQSEQFLGLPTPANAILITSLIFLPFELNKWSLIGITILSCYLLVSELPMLALKFSSFDLKSNLLRYLLILISILLVVFMGMQGIAFVIPTYIIISIVGNFASKKVV
ncbi:MAG: CDP-diacylglycerol--serine O-phosphatidyltransferase [Cyclobacteriaceae bacterium]